MQRFGQGSPYMRIKGILTTPEGKALWNFIQSRPAGDCHLYIPGVGNVLGYEAGNYIDSAGTTQAAVDQPVGLDLDAAGSVGAEATVGGDFSSAAQWSVIAGFTVASGSLSINAGGGAITNNAGSPAVIGKTYKIDFDVTQFTSGQIKAFMGNQGGVAANAVGHYTSYVVATTTDKPQIYVTSGATVCQVDNLVVREVTGIHASQSTPGYKPTIRRGIVNLLTYSNDLTNAAWVGSGVTAAKNAVAPDGSTTAHTLTLTTALSSFRPTNDITVTPLTTYTYAFMAKRGTATDFKLSFYNFTAGADILPATSVYADIGTDWALVVRQVTIPAGCTSLRIFMLRDSGVTGTVLVDRAGLFQGTLTAAQILAAGGIPLTTTAPASSSAGQNYLEFDGTDDRLALGGSLFQMSDDHCVVVGASVNGTSGLANQVIFCPAGDSFASSVKRIGQISYDSPSLGISASWYDGTNYDNISHPWPVGVPFVAAARKTGTTLELWVNGILRGTKAATVSGFIADSACVGSYPAPQAPNFFRGRIFGKSAIKGPVSSTDLIAEIKYIASLSGVQL